MSIENDILPYQTHVNQRLSDYLSSFAEDRLSSAMRYSTLQGGKRLRPLLVYFTAEMYDLPKTKVDPIAMAIECIHCYSLIHDDLPAMDNDDLRRGKPTCHKAYDEATAILAGDALLTLAFELLSQDELIPPRVIHLIAKAAGTNGMVGGQMRDLRAENQTLSLAQLIKIHEAKTGALITASVLAAALISDRPCFEDELALQHFGHAIGLAFQIQDDILDVTGETETLGKKPHQDHQKHKSTFVTQLGLQEACAQAQHFYTQALDALTHFGDKANRLRELSAFIIQRAL